MNHRIKSISDLRKLRQSLRKSRDGNRPCITVCAGTGCLATGASEVVERFRQEIINRHLEEKIDIRASGCHGFCERGPLVVIRPERVCYMNVEATDVPQILTDTVLEGKVIDRLLYQDPLTGEKIIHEGNIHFTSFSRGLFSEATEKSIPLRSMTTLRWAVTRDWKKFYPKRLRRRLLKPSNNPA